VRRVVLLSSLTVGRCFTVAESSAEFSEEERAGGLGATRTIMVPDDAWRVVAAVGEEVEAESATAETKRFPARMKVVEIPRQGWDRLVERVRGGT
jgi:hypothetical protein